MLAFSDGGASPKSHRLPETLLSVANQLTGIISTLPVSVNLFGSMLCNTRFISRLAPIPLPWKRKKEKKNLALFAQFLWLMLTWSELASTLLDLLDLQGLLSIVRLLWALSVHGVPMAEASLSLWWVLEIWHGAGEKSYPAAKWGLKSLSVWWLTMAITCEKAMPEQVFFFSTTVVSNSLQVKC